MLALKTVLLLVGPAAICVTSGVEEPSPVPEPPLEVGDAAPAFEAPDHRGQRWKSKEHVGGGYLVVFFYPSDFRFCTVRQVQKYQDRLEELRGHCATVVGVSGNTVQSHAAFHGVQRLDFPLLSDFDGEVARLFGVLAKRGGRTPMVDASGKPMRQSGKVRQSQRWVTLRRCTIVVGPDGKILYRNNRPSPVADVLEVLKVVSGKSQ